MTIVRNGKSVSPCKLQARRRPSVLDFICRLVVCCRESRLAHPRGPIYSPRNTRRRRDGNPDRQFRLGREKKSFALIDKCELFPLSPPLAQQDSPARVPEPPSLRIQRIRGSPDARIPRAPARFPLELRNAEFELCDGADRHIESNLTGTQRRGHAVHSCEFSRLRSIRALTIKE